MGKSDFTSTNISRGDVPVFTNQNLVFLILGAFIFTFI